MEDVLRWWWWELDAIGVLLEPLFLLWLEFCLRLGPPPLIKLFRDARVSKDIASSLSRSSPRLCKRKNNENWKHSRFINTMSSISAIDWFENLLIKYYIITYIFHSSEGIAVIIWLSFYLTTKFSELLLEVKTIMQLTRGFTIWYQVIEM